MLNIRSITDNLTDIVYPAFAEVIQLLCGISIESNNDDSILPDDDVIIGTIGLIGAVEWTIYIAFPKDTAEQISEAFCGFSIAFDSEDMGDATGEFANIAAGTVKTKLHKMGYEANISLPNVMRAHSPEVIIGKHSESSSACYDSSAGKLWLGLIISNLNRANDNIVTEQ